MINSISFTCWDGDEPLEVQLEPEAILLRVLPGNELTFKAECDADFKWTIRVENKMKALQLFADTSHPFHLAIYENAELLDDWYKYM
jgi:hypothetical protein